MGNKNKIFNLKWCWYEEQADYLFFHENKTEKQFKEDVIFLLRRYGEDYINKEKGWCSAMSWIDFISEKLETIGYIKVEPITWSYFGGYILDEGEDDEWREIVGDRLFNLAIEKNKDSERELDEERKKRNKQ